MAATMTMELPPQELASKVLRRARVSKMTRALQDRLALANIKIKHGWQHRSIDSLEPEIEQELKRKRADDPYSDTSSNASGRCFSAADLPSSSPLTGPIFSDELPGSGSSQGSIKRLKMGPPPPKGGRGKPRPARLNTSWKKAHQLPESSPITFKRTRASSSAGTKPISFMSETSTVLDSPSSSEDDDQDIPIHSFQIHDSGISSSPPRTPPPEISRPSFSQSSPFSSPTWSRKYHPGKEGADLLLYLASSPSPAMRVTRSDDFAPPSTPPSKHTPLPSSMLGTPGNLFGFNPLTPGTGFNFADFVNVTPSPAQAAFPKTPGTARTPTAFRDARRRLQLTPLMGVSPNADSSEWSGLRRGKGGNLELGDELRS